LCLTGKLNVKLNCFILLMHARAIHDENKLKVPIYLNGTVHDFLNLVTK